jgi:hypothetical protein
MQFFRSEAGRVRPLTEIPAAASHGQKKKREPAKSLLDTVRPALPTARRSATLRLVKPPTPSHWFWVDDTAGMIHFYGNLKNGVMDYWTDEIPQPDETKLKRHLQFIPQGTDQVRQFSQGATDGGNTWTVEYDLTYHRKK